MSSSCVVGATTTTPAPLLNFVLFYTCPTMAKTNTFFSSLSKTGAAAGATGAWLDVAAPSAFQSLANAPLPAGLSFGASISSTRLLPRFSGCFGPMAKVRNELLRIKCKCVSNPYC